MNNKIRSILSSASTTALEVVEERNRKLEEEGQALEKLEKRAKANGLLYLRFIFQKILESFLDNPLVIRNDPRFKDGKFNHAASFEREPFMYIGVDDKIELDLVKKYNEKTQNEKIKYVSYKSSDDEETKWIPVLIDDYKGFFEIAFKENTVFKSIFLCSLTGKNIMGLFNRARKGKLSDFEKEFLGESGIRKLMTTEAAIKERRLITRKYISNMRFYADMVYGIIYNELAALYKQVPEADNYHVTIHLDDVPSNNDNKCGNGIIYNPYGYLTDGDGILYCIVKENGGKSLTVPVQIKALESRLSKDQEAGYKEIKINIVNKSLFVYFDGKKLENFLVGLAQKENPVTNEDSTQAHM